ncbi:hypothetical protein FA15DRAFT_53638 [Coprinopsis marcescibilis]|uniref:receptor protein-tyrosine kinase n=1 Tax=Coprinopsis marcescibilis TaxID=230819 RepID=A0A5C3KND4_COPMA|nr:hypothetical protein FA15DRAFT_53638 [Coprinopsis marcescibilis]
MSTRFIDDRDPAVLYSPVGGWDIGGAPEEFNGTTSVARAPGAVAVVRFIGTGIQVIGAVPARNESDINPISTYLVDSISTTAREFRGAQLDGQPRRNTTFYEVSDLPHGPHFLTITQVAGEIWLDYFAVFGEEPVTPSVTRSDSDISKTSIDSGPSQPAPPLPPAPQSNGPPIGAIVGGAVGGILVLVIVAVVFFFVRRKRNLRRQTSVRLDATTPIQPFSQFAPDSGHGPHPPPPQSQHPSQPQMQSLLFAGYSKTSLNTPQSTLPPPMPNYAQSSYSSSYAVSSTPQLDPLLGPAISSKTREANTSADSRTVEYDALPPPAYSAAS